MKILVIQSDVGYLNRPKTAKELAAKAVRDRCFINSELTFVRLPHDLYETWYGIYEGDTGFMWTTKAKDGGLIELMKSVDYVLVDTVYNPWTEDRVVTKAIMSEEATNKVISYDKYGKCYVHVR